MDTIKKQFTQVELRTEMSETLVRMGTFPYNSPDRMKLKDLWYIAIKNKYLEEIEQLATVLLCPLLNSGHTTSYNDRYCMYYLSLDVGVKPKVDREIFQGVIRNAMSGYIEIRTHDKHAMYHLLKTQGVLESKDDLILDEGTYKAFSYEAVQRMVQFHQFSQKEMEIIVTEMCLADESSTLHLGGSHPNRKLYVPYIKKYVRESLQTVLFEHIKNYI